MKLTKSILREMIKSEIKSLRESSDDLKSFLRNAPYTRTMATSGFLSWKVTYHSAYKIDVFLQYGGNMGASIKSVDKELKRFHPQFTVDNLKKIANKILKEEGSPDYLYVLKVQLIYPK